MGYYWLTRRNRCGWIVRVERTNVADNYVAVYSNRHSPGRYCSLVTSRPHWVNYKGGITALYAGDDGKHNRAKARIAVQEVEDEARMDRLIKKSNKGYLARLKSLIEEKFWKKGSEQ